MTNVVTGEDAKAAMLAGITALSDAISGTLGPCAKTVIVSGVMEGRPPRILNDGVSIVNAVRSSDPATQTAIELFRQVSNEAQQASGDGTTTATVLAKSLIDAVNEHFNEGLTVKEIQRDLDAIVAAIRNQSTEIDLDNERDFDTLCAVATIAANNDKYLGELIGEMFLEIGEDGMVNMKVGSTDSCSWSKESGFTIPAGFASPMFANTPKKECVFDNPLIVLADEVIEDFDKLTPALEVAIENSRPIVFMVTDIKGIALSNLIANKLGGIVNACAIRMPKGGYDSEGWFTDTQAFCASSNVFRGFAVKDDEDDPLGIQTAQEGKGHFGTVDRIIVKENTTHFILSDENKNEHYKAIMATLLSGLNAQAENAEHAFDKEKLLARINRLNGTAATIYIGGVTELEIRETRERIDDAVNATRLALKGGYVEGGGMALVNALRWGIGRTDWWMSVLTAPYRQILSNGGFDPVVEDYPTYKMLDALTLKETVEKIIDPTEVVINSLKSAVSIVSLIMNTDTMVIVEKMVVE